MSLKIDRVELEIIVKQDSARQKMIELEDKMTAVNKQLNRLKKGTQEWVDKNNELQKLKTEYDKLFEGIGLGSLSIKELRNRQMELNGILRQIPADSPLYAQYKQQLDKINERMKELRGNAQETQSSLSEFTSEFSEGFSKYAGVAAGVVASITGVTMAARKFVDDFAKLEEAEAGVRKYTGMTTREVKELNEEFKKMDTRTPRERLNELAADAGRLGIQGKQDILDFVEAANVINVSLGEDLGEDAVKNIGKLAQMFGDDKTKGLRGAMLSTASAINEVAQNSSASEQYLVEFTARIAGTGKQAGISQAQIMGFASTLDQDMQKVEISATALQKVIMKVYQEPAKFAKYAGRDVKEFTEMLKTDANGAILQLLENIKKVGGLNETAPLFKEMKLDGTGAVGVLNTLAANVDKIRTEQERATQAYKEGTSAEKEYEVQNNTLQGTLEKANNRLHEISLELGEKLTPYVKQAASAGGTLIEALVAIVDCLIKYGSTIAYTIAVLAAYIAILKAQIIEEKIILFWKEKVIASTKRLYAILLAHPYAALAVAVVILITRLRDMNKEISESERLEQNLTKIRNTAIASVQAESKEVQQLLKIARDENLSKQEREAAIKRLNELSPEYLGGLTLEKINTEKATQAVNTYIDSLILLEEIKQAQSKLNELQEKRDNLLENGADNSFLTNTLAGLANMTNNFKTSLGLSTSAWANDILYDYGQAGVKQIRKIDTEVEAVNTHIEEMRKKLIQNQLQSGNNEVNNKIPGGGDKDKEALKKEEEALKNALNARQALIKKQFLEQKIDEEERVITEEEYHNQLYESEIKYLASKKKLLEDYKQDTGEVQNEIYDKMISEANRLYKAKQDAEKQAKDGDLKALDSSYEADKAAIKEMYLSGEVKTEQEYKDRMLEVELDYLESRKQLLLLYGEDTSKVEDQIADKRLDKLKDEKVRERKAQEIKMAGTTDKGAKLDILQAMYDADLINYEEYEKQKVALTKAYEKQREDTAKAVFQVIGEAAKAAGDIVNGMMDREINKVTARYDKQIKAAKKAGKDTTKLEEQKEEEINAIKKKYADKQFLAAVLQVTATTAVAAMEAYRSQLTLGPAGPILGALAAAATIAAGAAQIAVARDQQQQAKGLYGGGFSDEYAEGYTTMGNPKETAGVIPVHKNEFVINHEGVANPHVRQFLDVFNVAQKSGNIRLINTTQILERIRTTGKYEGGYTQEVSHPDSPSGFGQNGDDLKTIIFLFKETNRLLMLINEKELTVDSRDIRDGQEKLKNLERNISRQRQ
ncbi:hypothetical protein EZS27_003563 [termite gut metagenome]|uniref:Phage tail tape measure protein domain-containing protein n=1 Tax=termite gut metagenome TaxID=433724 RepID=A0A5J4SUJ7_9ZZZZ